VKDALGPIIAPCLGFGGDESCPQVFAPFGGFAGDTPARDRHARLPDTAGIGSEAKADLSAALKGLSAQAARQAGGLRSSRLWKV
jgi:hypothetical protein